jgi:hypothetical protein
MPPPGRFADRRFDVGALSVNNVDTAEYAPARSAVSDHPIFGYCLGIMHATPDALDTLEGLLVQIRQRPALTERKRGIFYRKSAGWLHFHGKPGDVHADLKVGRDWVRLPVNRRNEWQRLLAALDRGLKP